MTPAERDEVRAIAADNAKRRGHADDCDCDRCRHDRAVDVYVPAGVCVAVTAELLAMLDADIKTFGLRSIAHALHAAAVAAEETTR